MKIFVSHAVDDRELVKEFVDFIQLGAGLQHDEIFCSSLAGSIPNGAFFVQHILKELQAADLVICILSRSYFESEFCLAEVGAAQARRVAGSATIHSLIVPPVIYADLQGVLYGVQSGSILKAQALGALRDILTAGRTDFPGTPTWDENRDSFLELAKDIVGRKEAAELLNQIHVQDMLVEHGTGEGITFKHKLRIVFNNSAGKEIEVGLATWESGLDGIRLQARVDPLKWYLDDLSKESVHIPARRNFQTWIGLHPSVQDSEVLRRCATRKLGSLVLRVRINGHDAQREIPL